MQEHGFGRLMNHFMGTGLAGEKCACPQLSLTPVTTGLEVGGTSVEKGWQLQSIPKDVSCMAFVPFSLDDVTHPWMAPSLVVPARKLRMDEG